MKKRVLSFVLMAFMVFSLAPVVNAADAQEIKNVIYLIPDGGGMVPYQLAEAIKMAGGWEEGVFPNATPLTEGPLAVSPYLVGSYTTHCAEDRITDSAAAGTALSSGYRTKYGRVGTDANSVPHATLIEAAQYYGKKTGMVSIYEWMNATPAAFSSHHSSRSDYAVLSEQIVNQGIDVVLGAGFGSARWGNIAEAQKRGYNIIDTEEELAAVKPGDKIWGNLVDRSFSYDIENQANIPNLAEMTKAAITALDGDSENGFFLMVEGSKVDGAGHQNYAIGMAGDILAFDEACRVAIEYAKGRNDTLVLVGPDHDTGGMILPENMESTLEKVRKGIFPDEIKWESKDHTARRGGLFIYAPEGVSYPEGISGNDVGTMKAFEENIIDIPDLANYIAEKTGMDLQAVSKEIFVDVTDKGTYEEETGLFKFKDSIYTAKRNASYAYMGDECIDLEGQVSLYINSRFYVPQIMLDILEGKKEPVKSLVGPAVYSTLTVTMNGIDINSWKGEIDVANLLPSKEYNGEIKFTYPESFAAMEPIQVKGIAGSSKQRYEFECPPFDVTSGGLVFKYNITDEDGRISTFTSRFEPAIYATYTDKPITVDGVIDKEEWANGLVLKCDTIDSVVDIEDWKGPRDMSSEFSILWDEENLYFYAITTDEIFYTDSATQPLRNLDSVVIGLYEDSDDRFENGEDCSTLYEQIEMSLVEGNPDVRRERVQKYITAPKTSAHYVVPQDDEFIIKAVREGDYITYEAKFSWKKIYGYEYSPVLNDIMGFAFIATDNDGGGQRGYVEYAKGLGGTRDVNSFAKMIMLDPYGKKSPAPEDITVIFDGEEMEFDVEPINYNGRPMIPVRSIAEKLGAVVEWDNETKTAIIKYGETVVEMPTVDNTMSKSGWFFYYEKINGENRIIDVAAQLADGRTLASPEAISAAFGCQVNWDGATQTATITK